mmetsp:Transcript_117339/g.240043  ORF Transcript_117339/g.240043 Transcript_117339/m.240043 type:complete len:159 (-) Transcript_117339:31-507(-)
MHPLQNQDVNITLKNKPIFSGHRATNGLWLVPVDDTTPSPTRHLSNSAYTQSNTKALTLFLHASLGYPPTTTLCKAIDKGFLATFPGLHSSAAQKHIHNSIPTIMGRLTRTHGGLSSTSLTSSPEPALDNYDPPPCSNQPNKNTRLAPQSSKWTSSKA